MNFQLGSQIPISTSFLSEFRVLLSDLNTLKMGHWWRDIVNCLNWRSFGARDNYQSPLPYQTSINDLRLRKWQIRITLCMNHNVSTPFWSKEMSVNHFELGSVWDWICSVDLHYGTVSGTSRFFSWLLKAFVGNWGHSSPERSSIVHVAIPIQSRARTTSKWPRIVLLSFVFNCTFHCVQFESNEDDKLLHNAQLWLQGLRKKFPKREYKVR